MSRSPLRPLQGRLPHVPRFEAWILLPEMIQNVASLLTSFLDEKIRYIQELDHLEGVRNLEVASQEQETRIYMF
jgi:hypothetical protein